MILTGFMGSGKTTVGRRVAELLDREFIDLDHYIVESEGRTIPSIFDSEGEAGFREIEKESLKNVIGSTDAVISTGGGIITYEESRALLKDNEHHTVYYLSAPFELLYERIKDDENRPMLKQGYETVRALYESRTPLYEAACHHTVDAALSAEETAGILLALENTGGK